MQDPVTAEDGFNYEKSAIVDWLDRQNVSPQTKQSMGKRLNENRKLRVAILKFRRAFERLESGQAIAESEEIVWGTHGEQRAGGSRSIVVQVADGYTEDDCPGGTAALSMAQALSKAFLELDPLRELLHSVLDGWTPPKIVVIGDESAGKSTILEHLASLPVFPRKKRFCTRLAIHLRLRRAPMSKAVLSVFAVTADGQEVPEGEPRAVPQENGWAWVQEEMLRLVTELSEEHSSGIVTEKIIVVEVQRPDVPSIDLVDLPGLTTTPKDKADEIMKIFERQLEDDRRSGQHSIFLVVVPASGDVRPSTNMAVGFIKDKGLENRTLGVFSKCDQTADADVLRALALHENTAEGDSPEVLGSVRLQNWVACMLKPPEEEVLNVHNFERILTQRRDEAQFFKSDPELRCLMNRGAAGIGALIQHSEKQYYSYLSTTWKAGAMRKLLEKLHETEFQLSMLGVVKPADRDELAKREVQRRMGPGSPVATLYDKYLLDSVRGELCANLRAALVHLEAGGEASTVWEASILREELDKVKGGVRGAMAGILLKVESHWVELLRDVLTAENKVHEDAETSLVNIMTECVSGIHLFFFGEGLPKKTMKRELEEKPVIQLSHYREFTDAIMEKCKVLYREAVSSLEKDMDQLIERLVDIDSPWLHLRPEMSKQELEAGDVTKG